jgi:SseB protein C-terminal domain
MRPYKPAPEEKLVLHAVLLGEREVAEAYLVREDVEDNPRLIVGLRLKRRSLRLASRRTDQRLAARVAGALRLREPFSVILLNREARRLDKRLRRTTAPVYARATA